jgi:dienelactone hydrolase
VEEREHNLSVERTSRRSHNGRAANGEVGERQATLEVPREKLELRDDPALLSPPLLTVPLYACATAVNVTGYVPNATIDLEIDGLVAVPGYAGGYPAPFGVTIPVPALTVGQTLRARQAYNAFSSGWSANVTVRDHTVDFPAGLPRPELFPLPLFDCGVRTGVGNVLVGCDVSITADGNPEGAVQGANNPQGVNVSPAYVTGEHVRATAKLCADTSPPSVEQIVVPAPATLPTPGFEPVIEGGGQIVVNQLGDGATFSLARNGVNLGTGACWGGSITVGIPSPPVTAGDVFTATQQLCASNGPSAPGSATAQSCSTLPAPQVAPVQDGDTLVNVIQFVAGSEIRVFVNGVKTGDGSGPVVALTAPVPHNATIDVWQLLGTCAGRTVQQLTAQCIAPPVVGDPSALDLFPVGIHEYQDGQVTFDGFTYDVAGSIYYPADDDGTDKPFNARLAATGRAPVVVCVHGAHSDVVPSYHGYDYFQAALARMGFVAVSVDERQCDRSGDWDGWTQNIVRRAELALASIAYLQQQDAADPIFAQRLDFRRVGLMGHSRGAECVIAVAERNNLAGVTIASVLSLAPVDSGATSGRPNGYPFMTFLPAADGDVWNNPGARFYDQAATDYRKTQLYIDAANHNFFNRQWTNDDAKGRLPLMSRPDHERILLAYGCAFFRTSLRGEPLDGYLQDEVLPTGVQTQNVHLAFDVPRARVVDNYEGHPITVDSEGQATAQLGGLVAKEYAFTQGAGAFNGSFYGESTGNVANAPENVGRFREPLANPLDLRRVEIRVRAAEVYEPPTIPPNTTGFRVGVEDGSGTIAWIDVDDVGGLSRPFDRNNLDGTTKTMLSTFRFPGHCFAAQGAGVETTNIVAVHLGLNRGDRRHIAFDDLEVVRI